MLQWIPYAFLRITACFIAGIISAIYMGEYLSPDWAPAILIAAVVLYLVGRKILKKQFFSKNWLLSLIAFSTIFLAGYFNLVISKESLNPNHIIHQDSIGYYIATVAKPGEERAKTMRYELEVSQFKNQDSGLWQNGSGKLFAFIDKAEELSYGDRLLIKGKPNPMTPPANPGEFDYKRFLSFKNIYHQQFIRNGDFKVIDNIQPNVLFVYGHTARKWASGVLAKHIDDPRELSIAKALVLGVKDGLDNDIQQAYAASGAMHVLAVSGLHVGIIYLIILLIFGRLQHHKTGRWVLAILCLTLLWAYAMITGFSPSVLRAVTMFSFIAVAKAANRHTNIYNTLAASAFVLLLFDPFLIMSVGFQLSFLAVLGIVYVQPKLYNLFTPENRLVNKVWAITTVAFAAQLATFPLGLLYFHQFPTFFFISNLVVIPGAFVILVLGLMVIAAGMVEALAGFFGQILEWCIFGVNEIVFFLQDIPHAQISGVHVTVFETWLIISIIIFLLIFFQVRKISFARASLALALMFCFYRVEETFSMPDDKITFYKVNHHTAVDFISRRNSFLLTDSALYHDEGKMRFHIQPNHLISQINSSHWLDGKGVESGYVCKEVNGMQLVSWKNTSMVILNQPRKKSVKFSDKIKVDYLLVCRQFNSDLGWINNNFIYKQLILDGSLSWYQANKLEKEAQDLSLPYYSVVREGAYEVKI